MLTVGHKFPEFSLKSVVANEMPHAFSLVSTADMIGRWNVVFFYPKDFTFVCPTELQGFDELMKAFSARKTGVYGVSTDSEFVHLAWRRDAKELRNLSYPLVSDIKRELSMALGILDAKEGVCLRATFIVDPEGIIRHVSVNDLSVGRNPEEILRVLDALQVGGLMPCRWQPGQEAIKVA
ncbi:MAG: peroxiredoxin [Alphaproteobacteria bacterium]|nr:MAG: peroxiredoxin [Alphaproteobacteria bacterium]